MLQAQVETLPEGESLVKSWLQRTTGAIQQQIAHAQEAVRGVSQTFQDLDSKGRVAFSQVRQSNQFQTFQDTVREGVQTARDWLSSRPDAIIHHRFARDAMTLLEQGHDRTFESAYQVGDFQISRQGQQTFAVINPEGDRLLQFKAKRSVLPGQVALSLQAVNGDAKDFYKALQAFRKPETRAIGAADKEVLYTAKVQQTVGAIQQSLDALGADHLSVGGYQFQAAEDSITIRAQGRKEPIYTSERSQLTPKDFKQLQKIGQQIMQDSVQNRPIDEAAPRSDSSNLDTVGLILDAGDLKSAGERNISIAIAERSCHT